MNARSIVAIAVTLGIVLAAHAAEPVVRPVIRNVEVDEGIRLETLDWGGSGPDVVLLAGLGNTAHVFDSFAARLAADCRVVGITRRGYGASTHANGGYDPRTLARDIAVACDSLGIARPILAGHSLAGTEIAFFASRYPGRLRAAVLLDAGYDHSRVVETIDMAPPPAPAPPAPSDLADAASVQDWLRRTRGPLIPLAEITALYAFAEDGGLKDANASPLAQGLIMDALEPPPWRRLDAPVLAIYTKPTLRSLYPAHRDFDRADRAVAVRRVSILRQMMSADLATLEASCPRAEVIVRDGANHYIFLTEPTLALTAVRAFVHGLEP